MNLVKFEITVNASVTTGDYGSKEAAFGALGAFLDSVEKQYGGILGEVRCMTKDYKQNNGDILVQVEKITALMHCRGISS